MFNLLKCMYFAFKLSPFLRERNLMPLLCNIIFLKSIQLPNRWNLKSEAHTVLYGSGAKLFSEKGVSLNLLGVSLNPGGCRSITPEHIYSLSLSLNVIIYSLF